MIARGLPGYRILAAVLSTFALAFAAPGVARAEVFNVCEIRQTADGWVALRSTPSVSGQIVARMVPGHVLVLDRTGNTLVMRGKWFRAAYYPGEAMPNPGDPGHDKIRKGWVHTSVVGDCG